jgi:hypothetical protein
VRVKREESVVKEGKGSSHPNF